MLQKCPNYTRLDVSIASSSKAPKQLFRTHMVRERRSQVCHLHIDAKIDNQHLTNHCSEQGTTADEEMVNLAQAKRKQT